MHNYMQRSCNCKALELMEEVLGVRRRTLGDEDPDTLDSITNLALHHLEMGNCHAALPLSIEAVEASGTSLHPLRGQGFL